MKKLSTSLVFIALTTLCFTYPHVRPAAANSGGGSAQSASAVPASYSPLVDSPGAISFAARQYGVGEGDGAANITLTRTGGGGGALAAKVTVTDATTSPADYLYSQGAIDTTFSRPPSVASFYGNGAVTLQPDGKLLIADARGVWRLNSDGSIDETFDAGNATNNRVYAVAVQPDGKVVIVGGFTTFNNKLANRIARLNADGTLDTTFKVGTGADNDVTSVVVQADGKILIAGSFFHINGKNREGVARLNATGSLDTSYAYQQSSVRKIVLQPDGKALMGGFYFDHGVARVNTDGTPDLTFTRTSGAHIVFDIAVQPDGKILIAGSFDHVDGQVAYNVARLNADGEVDTTFNAGNGPNTAVSAIALQPDGKVFIGGSFSSFNGKHVMGFARLNANGSLDATFSPDFVDIQGTAIESIAVQPDGKVILSGNFTISEPDVNANNLARLTNELFVTWADGDVSDKVVSLPIVDDQIDEPTETLNLQLVPLMGAPTGVYTSATLTITDNDPTPAVSVNDPAVVEGNAAVTATFTVSLSGASSRTVTVQYRTADGTALAPADYEGLALTTLTFAPGQTTRTVAVQVKGDLLDEAAETFKLRLSAATNAIISDPEGVATIYDNDSAPSLKLNNITVAEAGPGSVTAGTFTVSLSTASGQTVSVKYQTANGTAVASADYTAKALATLTFLPGETVKTVAVQVRGDALDEVAETFRLLLSSPTNALISDGEGVCTITDDDPPPTITINDASVTEPDTGTRAAVFTVKLSAASGRNVTVKFVTANGTAAAGTDYTAVALTTLTFLPGQTSKTVAVQVKGDLVLETDETFFVNLSGATNASIADTKGLGTILNDD